MDLFPVGYYRISLRTSGICRQLFLAVSECQVVILVRTIIKGQVFRCFLTRGSDKFQNQLSNCSLQHLLFFALRFGAESGAAAKKLIH